MSRSTLSRPFKPRWQWEKSSGTVTSSQSNNCGPTGASQQADYYVGSADNPVRFGIEATRVLAAPRGVPTNAWQQATMSTKRTGVTFWVTSITDMNHLIELLNDHRPIGIGIQMSRLSAKTRGHSFLGWHRVTLLAQRRRWKIVDGRLKWVRGVVYTDPNFHPPGTGYREDPKKGHRWMSRRELNYAFIQNWPAYAIVPEESKP